MKIDEEDHIPDEDSSFVFLPYIVHDFVIFGDLISRLGKGILAVDNGVDFLCRFRVEFFNFIGVSFKEFLLTGDNIIELFFVGDLVS